MCLYKSLNILLGANPGDLLGTIRDYNIKFCLNLSGVPLILWC